MVPEKILPEDGEQERHTDDAYDSRDCATIETMSSGSAWLKRYRRMTDC